MDEKTQQQEDGEVRGLSLSGESNSISRQHLMVVCRVDTVLADAKPLNLSSAAGAILKVPAGVASQSVEVYAGETAAGTFVPLYDAAGDPVTVTVEGDRAYDLPEALYAATFAKFKSATSDFDGIFMLKG